MAHAASRKHNISQNKSQLNAGIDLIKQGKFVQAEHHLNNLLQQWPDDPLVKTVLADSLYHQDKYKQALGLYSQALKAGITANNMLLNLATCHIQCEEPDKAIPLVEQVLKAEPENAIALGVKGEAHRHNKQPSLARQYLFKSLEINPNQPNVYEALAHLETFTANSPIFDLLSKRIESDDRSPKARAISIAALAKAYLDIGEHTAAFEYFQQANNIVDESLPQHQPELERLLIATRSIFTPNVFKAFSQFGIQETPQIIIAGMSRSGKSLVESLFRGVKGVELAGEAHLLADFRNRLIKPYDNRIDAWLTDQTPESIQAQSQDYLQHLNFDGTIKITTIPGDLWNLGLIGLWAPNVPIIFTVRNVLDLGITGYFQQYQQPEGHRYSYNLQHLGRQIAIFEKAMEHWAQVLPNPIYLVDYEALVADPQAVMQNLLDQLNLERIQNYDEIVGENAHLIDVLSPIVSTDAPMPITNRFIGIASHFQNQLKPMIDGYSSVIKEFPRIDPPAAIPFDLPESIFDGDSQIDLPSETVKFDWQLQGQLTVFDNGGYLLKNGRAQELIDLQAFGLVVFDPAGDKNPESALLKSTRFQYVPQALLGNGESTTFYACLNSDYNSTLAPLPENHLNVSQANSCLVLAQIPVNTFALDSIDGIDTVDWLILGAQDDSVTILEHGVQRLANTLLLQANVLFTSIYQQQPSFAELTHWAARHGFQFYKILNAINVAHMPEVQGLAQNPAPSQLQRADLIFIPSTQRLAQLSDAQRLKLAFLLDTVYNIHDLSFDLLRQIGSTLGENYLKARGYYDYRSGGPTGSEIHKLRNKIRSGNISSTSHQVAQLLRQYNIDPQVRRACAELHSWSGKQFLAIHRINQAISYAPSDISIYISAIEILLRAGIWWEAKSSVQTLQQLMPNNNHINFLLTQAIAAQPSTNKDELHKALKLIGQLIEGYDLGRQNMLTSHQEVVQFKEIDYTTPQLPELFGTKARLLNRLKQNDTAIHWHDKAIKLSYDQNYAASIKAKVYFEKGLSLKEQERLTDAKTCFWQAASVYPVSFITQKAQECLEVLSVQNGSGLEKLAHVYDDLRIIKKEYESDLGSTQFGLYAQSLDNTYMTGLRPSGARIKAYGLSAYLGGSKLNILDANAHNGFLLLSLIQQLGDHVSYALGLSVNQADIAIAKQASMSINVAADFERIAIQSYGTKTRFDLILACGLHAHDSLSASELGHKLHRLCAENGLVLLESNSVGYSDFIEPGFVEQASKIASAGFKVLDVSKHCDDGINTREFWVLQKI